MDTFLRFLDELNLDGDAGDIRKEETQHGNDRTKAMMRRRGSCINRVVRWGYAQKGQESERRIGRIFPGECGQEVYKIPCSMGISTASGFC